MSQKTALPSSEHIYQILGKYSRHSTYLLAALEDVQSEFGYVSADAMKFMAAYFDTSEEMVSSLTADCSALHVTPPAKHVLHVCQGPLCSASGGRALIVKAREAIGACKNVRLVAGHCLGSCHDAPVAKLDASLMCCAKPGDVIRQLRLLNDEGDDRLK